MTRLTILGLLAGCGPVYLHSGAEEQALREARQGFDTARDAHLALLDEQRAVLDQAAEADRLAIIDNAITERDAAVVVFLDAGQGWRELLQARIGDRSAELIGSRGAIDGELDIRAHQSALRDIEADLTATQGQLERAIRSFELAGGKAAHYCLQEGERLPDAPEEAPSDEARQWYEAIGAHCNGLAGAREEAAFYRGRLLTVGDVVLPLPNRVALGGELEETTERLDALDELVAAQRRLAATAKATLMALERS